MKFKRIHYLIIVLVVLLAGIFFLSPTTTRCLCRGSHLTQLMSNGRNLCVLFFAKSLDSPFGRGYKTPSSYYPTTKGENVYTNSTEYFKSLINSEDYNLNDAFFMVWKRTGKRDDELTRQNNAWCVVADINESMPSNSPCLFTKNLVINSLDESAEVTHVEGISKDKVVVVMMNCRALVMTESEVNGYLKGLNLTNRVLRP